MTQEPRNVAWQVAPGPGKCNTMTVEPGGGVQSLLKLQVLKPGVRREYDVTLPCPVGVVFNAAKEMPGNWHTELARTDKDGIFTATRLFFIHGTPYVVRWILKHVDVNGDGTAFTVDDTLDVLCITPDRSSALHLLAI